MPKKLTQEEFCKRVKEYTNDSIEVISPYVNKRTKVRVKCRTCGNEWDFSPTTLMPSNMKDYSFIGCSQCKYEEVECDYCHKKFSRLKSRLEKDNKTGRVYCSRECGNRDKNDNVANLTESTNYRRNAFLIYEHKCAICGWCEDERILEVHHIDEDRNNNHIDNLIILCPICHKKLTLHLYELNELKIKSA